MSENQPAEDIRILLQSVETDTARTSSSRNQIRQSVLTTFDDATVAPAEIEPASVDPIVAPSGNEAQVLPIVSLNDRPKLLISSRRSIAWAGAAAAAVVLLVGLALLGSREQYVNTGPTGFGTAAEAPAAQAPAAPAGQAPAVSEERRLRLDNPELPALLLPGPQTTDSIAGGLSFDAPDGLAVIDQSAGQLVLTLADEEAGSVDRLIIVETELSDFEGLLRTLAEAGDVSLKEIGLMVNGRATTRFDVAVTNQAIAARSCSAGEPCIHLQDTSPASAALWAGADNRIVEIGRTEDSVVLAIEVSQRFTGPLSRLAAQVVNSSFLAPE